MFFAATLPQRVSSLVLVNAYARFLRSEDTPWGMPGDRLRSSRAGLHAGEIVEVEDDVREIAVHIGARVAARDA